MKAKNYLTIIIALVFFSACSSGYKKLTEGEFEQALYKAVNRLNQNPNKKKAKKVVPQAYQFAFEGIMKDVNADLKDNDVYKWDRVISGYSKINRMNKALENCYSCKKMSFTRYNVTEDLAYAKTMSGNAHLDFAKNLLKSNDKVSIRKAYNHLISARLYHKNKVEITNLMNKSVALGTERILLLFNRNKRLQFALNPDVVYERSLNNVRNINYTFLQIHTSPSDIDNVDEIINVDLSYVNIGNVSTNRVEKQLSKDDVVIGEDENEEGEKIDLLGTVKAEYVEMGMVLSSDGALFAKYTNSGYSKSYSCEINWGDKWAFYKGDKRALSDAQYDLTCKKPMDAPAPFVIFEDIAEDISIQLANDIRRQFSYLN